MGTPVLRALLIHMCLEFFSKGASWDLLDINSAMANAEFSNEN